MDGGAGGGGDIGAYESQGQPIGFPAGDYNQDGIADVADYTVWRDTLGSTTDLRADGNGNSVVDLADYEFWRQNFGNTDVILAPPAPNIIASASEPPPADAALALAPALPLVAGTPTPASMEAAFYSLAEADGDGDDEPSEPLTAGQAPTTPFQDDSRLLLALPQSFAEYEQATPTVDLGDEANEESHETNQRDPLAIRWGAFLHER